MINLLINKDSTLALHLDTPSAFTCMYGGVSLPIGVRKGSIIRCDIIEGVGCVVHFSSPRRLNQVESDCDDPEY